MADEFLREVGLGPELEHYELHRWNEDAERWPVLSLDDYSGIPFLKNIGGIEAYQHRARIRARTGDVFATITPPTPGYETYCRERLGLGEVESLEAEAIGSPLEVARACSEGAALERIAAKTRDAGGIALHPYMGIEPVWKLAERIASITNQEVRVLAPPPPVTWIANDKASLAELADRAVGPWLNSARETVTTPSALAAALQRFAARHARVGIKRPRCASAMGNRVLSSESLEAQSRLDLEALARAFWTDKEVEPDEPVLVVAWEDAVSSPSTQMWIPARGRGEPRLDGIYEQLLEGEEKIFCGSEPSLLPRPVEEALAHASYLLSAALQELGYVGRCSCDFIVVGDLHGDFEVRVTDCNGRWGGTSTPMLLVERSVPGPRQMYHAQDFVRPELIGMPFSEILERVGDAAYDHRAGTGRYLFYNVGCLDGAGKLDVVALGESRDEVQRAIGEDLPRLLGLSG